MRALVTDPSATPPLALAEVPEPAPGPGQVLIEMEAASVNRGEVRAARRQRPGKMIGWDVAGTVAALGEGVDQFEVGQRVVAWARDGGSFAERVVAPADWAAPLPAACDSVTAATLPIAGLTALGILRTARVHAGDRVLVTGAAGGVGLLTVQLAHDAGAKVTGQARTADRARVVAEAGAEPLLHPGDGGDVDGTYDVVLDGIGGPMVGPLLRAAAPHGRVVVYGNSADAESTFRVEDFYPKAVTIYGFRVFISVPPDQGVKDLARLADEVASGRLAVQVQATAPLADALDLIRDLYDRKVTGKAVITFGP
jgi:NADPH:quinone reductase-like Zn-dependent oxidoreductase